MRTECESVVGEYFKDGRVKVRSKMERFPSLVRAEEGETAVHRAGVYFVFEVSRRRRTEDDDALVFGSEEDLGEPSCGSTRLKSSLRYGLGAVGEGG